MIDTTENCLDLFIGDLKTQVGDDVYQPFSTSADCYIVCVLASIVVLFVIKMRLITSKMVMKRR